MKTKIEIINNERSIVLIPELEYDRKVLSMLREFDRASITSTVENNNSGYSIDRDKKITSLTFTLENAPIVREEPKAEKPENIPF